MVNIYKDGHYKIVPETRLNHFLKLGYNIVEEVTETPQEEPKEELSIDDMTRPELMAQLKELNIPFSITMKKIELLELLKEVVSSV